MKSKSNLIIFPGGGRKTEADKLLIEFVDVCIETDQVKKMNELELLRLAIFSYVGKMQNKGLPA